MSISREVDAENVPYIQNGILFRNKRRGNPAICSNRDESREHYVKRNKPGIEEQMLQDITYMWNV